MRLVSPGPVHTLRCTAPAPHPLSVRPIARRQTDGGDQDSWTVALIRPQCHYHRHTCTSAH
eukprot:1400753-Prymnesium_polylepis.1